MKKKLVIILIGAPGCGKGTQAALMSKIFKLISISPGDIFRHEVNKKTQLGKRIDSFLKKGLLVPDDVVSKIIINKIKKTKGNIILDGFPRNLVQVKLLDEYLRKIDSKNLVLEISLTLKESITRVLGRLYCPNCEEIFNTTTKPPARKMICDHCGKGLKRRVDEKPNVVEARWQIYRYETKPIIEYYKKYTKYTHRRVDGAHPVQDVFVNINEIITEIHDQIKKS